MHTLDRVHRYMILSGQRLTLPVLFREANASQRLIEKFGNRLFGDLATLTVLHQACVVLKGDTSKQGRDRVQQEMLNRTEQITRAMRSIGCSNYTSPIANAAVLQLSNHTAITLRRLHDEAQGSIEDTLKLLPTFSTLALETAHCQHANASQLLADALTLFGDNESDSHEVRRYYSDEYNQVKYVLSAYIEQLSEGGSALSTAVS